MVLPKMQITQISKETTQHLSRTKGLDPPLKAIQTKRHIQEIKERDTNRIPLLAGLIAIFD